MKTITGCLAILLGGAGALITLALVGVMWWGVFKLTAEVQKATEQADKSLAQTEESLGKLRARLVETSESVEAVRVTAAKARDRANSPAAKVEVERLRANLLPLIERVDASREALPPIADLLENAATLAEQGGNQTRAERLRAIAGKAREAAKELESLRATVSTVYSRATPPTATEVESMAQQTRRPLDRITAALADLQQESEKLRKELPEARQKLDEWKFIGAAAATGVLLWVALGQLAIVSWGRRRLAARYVTASQPTTGAK